MPAFHPVIERARNHGTRTDFYLAQTDAQTRAEFPFGNTNGLVADWLERHGYHPDQRSQQGYITRCGMYVSVHGVVRALHSSNL